MAPTRKPLTTVKQIKALKAEPTHYVRSIAGPGASGLYIKVLKSGRKHFEYRYRHLNEGAIKTEWIRLGEYTGMDGGMDLHGATLELAKQRVIVKEHGSVSQYLKIQREAKAAEVAAKVENEERSSFTVRKLVEDYINAVSTPSAKKYIKSYRKVQLSLENHIVSKIGDKPAHEVHRLDVSNALEELDKAGKQVQRNRVLAYFSRAFNWAIINHKFVDLETQGVVIVNPCGNIEKAEETPKERSLATAEIRRLLKNLPDSGIREDIADAYRLILLLAARPGEVVRMRYSDIQQKELIRAGGKKVRINTLELKDTKNTSTLVQPLSDQALKLIERRKKESDYIFPSPQDDNRHLREDTLNKPLRDNIGRLKVLPFAAHDLRRTAVTEMSSIVDENGQKITRFIKKLILNHKDQSVTGTYDRFEYLEEKWLWMVAWGKQVEDLAGTKPMELRKVG